MARKPKMNTLPDVKKKARPDLITIEREYELITPLYGGSATAGEVDTEHPIRGSSIRGQLRFWWRATRGGEFGDDLNALKKAEGKIWGAVATPNARSEKTSVSLSVNTVGKAKRLSSVSIRKKRGIENVGIGEPESPYGYVAFPLRLTDEEKRANKAPRALLENVAFTLRLTFHRDYAPEVKAALWAWDTFGGIGARTRRGFGALSCQSCNQIDAEGEKVDVTDDWCWLYDKQNTADAILEDVRCFVSEGEPHPHLPHLSRQSDSYKCKYVGNPDQVWKNLFTALKNFRQNRPNPPYGRSNWPEADAIRRVIGKSHYPTDKDPRKYVYKKLDKFPRAQFGLPLIFQFKDYKDPNPVTLEGAKSDSSRLASPLIIRPLRCADNNAIGLAIALRCPKEIPGGIVLKEGDTVKESDIEIELEQTEADQVAKHHTTYDGTELDMVQAFLNTL